MKPASRSSDSLSLHLRLRVTGREKVALGPGKVDLLKLLAETGSIREAASQMDMSYMKAWKLIQTMKPLVATTRGGSQRGGAEITDTGRQVLALYQKMEQAARRSCEPAWRQLQTLLRR